MESYERIHRSNLIGMGVLPLQFKPGENAETLGIDGTETFEITGISNGLKPRQDITIKVSNSQGEVQDIQVRSRLDTQVEIDYYRNGGVLHTVLRRMLKDG